MPKPLVNPIELAKEVAYIWEGDEYNNISSPALEESWTVIAESFNECIRANQRGANPPQRLAIPAQTGTGKTTAMIQYAIQSNKDIGILIVTAFIDEIDKIVEHVNKGLNKSELKAAAFHSSSDEHRYNLDNMKKYQVLVITHNQFVGATDRNQNEVGVDRGRIHKLYDYNGTKRDLVIIDDNPGH
ncbi:hypothetical protein BHECKSOX_916 [Bathymodiolus heckerae thiotrophic gill symbiont]|uniref:DEAD/DEAH box helicase n=1 Tax=Bathymodiolus heckerae thiotrophic gill symbiont TaxID=1052212 RepID=UPI0010B40508|nr:DEAD/DEAH box helicase [Bathymodiolus heckerae thiotrophic gill symbiont]SHN92495.1 hypothetical protein BHECKSOX_916 [Bathymodiolus heckerae thiotrophic gill symbiont]